MRVIAGNAHGRRIAAPRGFETRPATARVRASIFSRIAARFDLTGARVLDLFAGSGSLGLEALSRGAAEAVFVDSSRAAVATIAKNLAAFGLTGAARIVTLDVMRAIGELAAAGEHFDLAFVDAPYAHDNSAAVLAALVGREVTAARGWIMVRQAGRAPRLEPAGVERVNEATLGDHRIALYRRLPQPPQ
ncbi:MAG: 16S rRNA (guanine(966)-N(2))-methyltransferase RsmD [Candidatus Binataceae bacterium]|nr:16S rRNA (guanine(966)-N(2))-methyltransferase RsmD [Candidatus Binataceae bacterium]